MASQDPFIVLLKCSGHDPTAETQEENLLLQKQG